WQCATRDRVATRPTSPGSGLCAPDRLPWCSPEHASESPPPHPGQRRICRSPLPSRGMPSRPLLSSSFLVLLWVGCELSCPLACCCDLLRCGALVLARLATTSGLLGVVGAGDATTDRRGS